MRRAGLCALLLLASACGGDEPACDPASSVGCSAGLVCEAVNGRERPACLPPVVVRGKLFDGATGAVLVGARVLAVTGDGAPLAPAASTAFDGSYEIRVRATRDAALRPLSAKLRIHAAATGYGNFPDAWRDWPELDLAQAQPTEQRDKLVLATESSNLRLIPFAGGPGRGVLSGHVDLPGGEPRQIVVVAESETAIGGRPRGISGWADSAGNYALFGLPAADLRVRAYAKGASYGERRIGLNVGEQTTLDLRLDGSPGASVSGAVEVAGTTQVALVVASTWDPESSAGEEPAGLRATVRADGGFTVAGVPAGSYVVVDRDADGWVMAGAAPAVTVGGGDATVAEPLRLVQALAVIAPGAERPEAVTPPVSLSWQDHAAEARYQVDVLNAIGATVMSVEEPAHAGDVPSLALRAPLVAGQVYRFRVRALDAAGALLGRTEDRRGVFYLRSM